MRTRIIIVARPSEELHRALDALDDVRDAVTAFEEPADAAAALLSGIPPNLNGDSVGAVFIEVTNGSRGVAELVTGLRRREGTRGVPIILWGPTEACERLDPEVSLGVNSLVRTESDPQKATMTLAQTIHYWTSVNRPAYNPAYAATGDPA